MSCEDGEEDDEEVMRGKEGMGGKKKEKWKKAQILCAIILTLLVTSQNISSPFSPANNSTPSLNSTFPSATPSPPPLNISAPSIVSFEPKSMIVCDHELSLIHI